MLTYRLSIIYNCNKRFRRLPRSSSDVDITSGLNIKQALLVVTANGTCLLAQGCVSKHWFSFIQKVWHVIDTEIGLVALAFGVRE